MRVMDAQHEEDSQKYLDKVKREVEFLVDMLYPSTLLEVTIGFRQVARDGARNGPI